MKNVLIGALILGGIWFVFFRKTGTPYSVTGTPLKLGRTPMSAGTHTSPIKARIIPFFDGVSLPVGTSYKKTQSMVVSLPLFSLN